VPPAELKAINGSITLRNQFPNDDSTSDGNNPRLNQDKERIGLTCTSWTFQQNTKSPQLPQHVAKFGTRLDEGVAQHECHGW
jgi:hypothetical protein